MDHTEAKRALFAQFDRSPELVEAWGRSHHRDQAWAHDKGLLAAHLMEDQRNYQVMFDVISDAGAGEPQAIARLANDPDLIQFVAHMAGTAMCEVHGKLIEEYHQLKELGDDGF